MKIVAKLRPIAIPPRVPVAAVVEKTRQLVRDAWPGADVVIAPPTAPHPGLEALLAVVRGETDGRGFDLEVSSPEIETLAHQIVDCALCLAVNPYGAQGADGLLYGETGPAAPEPTAEITVTVTDRYLDGADFDQFSAQVREKLSVRVEDMRRLTVRRDDTANPRALCIVSMEQATRVEDAVTIERTCREVRDALLV